MNQFIITVLLDQKPREASRFKLDLDVDRVISRQRHRACFTFLFAHLRRVAETCVVQRQPQALLDTRVGRVEDHGETFLGQERVDMHERVDRLHVGSTHVYDVARHDVAVTLVEGNPLGDDGLRLVAVEKSEEALKIIFEQNKAKRLYVITGASTWVRGSTLQRQLPNTALVPTRTPPGARVEVQTWPLRRLH